MANLIGKDIIYTCVTDDHQFKVPSDIVKDGVSCPKCGAFAIATGWAGKGWRDSDNIPFYTNNQSLMKARRNDKEQSLLTIVLQDETSVPKVVYKGKEIDHKVNIHLDWDTDTELPGGLTYAIEHTEMRNGYPTVNRIERRVKGHA